MYLFRFKKKAYTLIELLVTLVLFLVIGSAIFYLFIQGLKWFLTFSGTEKQEISTEFNVDILIFDLKHVGYGISTNETNSSDSKYLILSYCNGTSDTNNPACNLKSYSYLQDVKNGKILLIKETSNIIRPYTLSFLLWKKGIGIVDKEPNNVDLSGKNCIWLDLKKTYLKIDDCENPNISNTEGAIGFPLDEKTSCNKNTCTCSEELKNLCCYTQNCTGIVYFVKKTSGIPQKCTEGAYIFYRSTLNYLKNNLPGIPLLNCVADWDVWVEMDTDQDGAPDTYNNTIPNNEIQTNTDLKEKLYAVDIYFLIQTSYSPDYKYDFSKGNKKVNASEGYIIADTLPDGTEVKLYFPAGDEWRHYHWKVFKVKVTDFLNLKF